MTISLFGLASLGLFFPSLYFLFQAVRRWQFGEIVMFAALLVLSLALFVDSWPLIRMGA